jgi:hypothetical protein
MSLQKTTTMGIVATLMGLIAIVWFMCESGECADTAYARNRILSILTPEQAKTLRPTVTLSDKNLACTWTFVFVKNGKEVEVSFMPDEVHGMKFYSSDGGETAAWARSGNREIK